MTMFRGELEYLSNFSPYPAWFDGWKFPTAEHAFQAAKTLDTGVRTGFLQGSPGEAKRLGRRVEMREDWEQVKLMVMRQVLASKFTMTPQIGYWLLATGIYPLVETNTWHDNIWGDCECGRPACQQPGQNLLGISLMRLREFLGGQY